MYNVPRMMAPAALSFLAIVESRGTFAPSKEKEPAVLFIKSSVAMLFLISTVWYISSGLRGEVVLSYLGFHEAVQ